MSNQPQTKILFLITKSNWGGAQRYVYDLATTLAPNQHEVVVALGGSGELQTKLASAGIKTITLNSLQRDVSIKNEIVFALELYKIIRQERPYVLHVNSSKAGGLGCFIGRLAFVPRIIFTAHGWAFNENRPWWQKLVVGFFHWLTVVLSHHTIAVSHATKQQLRGPWVQKKMSVINPGRALPDFLPRTEARQKIGDLLPRFPTSSTDPLLMTIAELHPIKNHTGLFDAMQTLVKQFPTLRLVCIGEGQLHATLQQHINDQKLAANIFLTGAIHEAADYLRAADIFILPSSSESYGYVLHEAALARVPTIATNVGGIPDVVESGVTGTLVPTGDTQALVDAVTTYLTNPALATTHAQAAHNKIRARDLPYLVRATEQVYGSRIISSPNTDSRLID